MWASAVSQIPIYLLKVFSVTSGHFKIAQIVFLTFLFSLNEATENGTKGSVVQSHQGVVNWFPLARTGAHRKDLKYILVML